MNKFVMLLLGAAALPACLHAEEIDRPHNNMEQELSELVVVSKKSAVREEADRLIYTAKNDPYAKGLNGMEILDRIPTPYQLPMML